MTDPNKDYFPPRDFGEAHRAAFVAERKRYEVGCPKCGARTQTDTPPTKKKPVECHGCGLKLLPTS